jgi:hypothetical protein
MESSGKGQTILEVLIALSALLVLLSAISVIILSSLNQSVSSNNLTQATLLAQEGIELARGKADLSVGEVYCVGEDKIFQLSPGTCQESAIGIFQREVSLEPGNCGSGNEVRVAVSWSDAKCSNGELCHTSPVSSCL